MTPTLHRSFDAFPQAIERQRWLDAIGKPLTRGAKGLFRLLGPLQKHVENFLNGSWWGHPLHPALTDVPIGAWTAALVLDGCEARFERSPGLRRAADTAVSVGVIGAIGAALSGLADYQHLKDKPRRVGAMHATLNSAALALYLMSLGARRRGERGRGRALARTGYAAVLASSYLGGYLVYRQRIGVTHAELREDPILFTPVLPAADLNEGDRVAVEVEGVRVALFRKSGRIYALGATCSHLGGPLEEGQLHDDSIQCPWHGTRFSLHDGCVMQGPGTAAQPVYETRVRNGQIEIRRATRLSELRRLAPAATAAGAEPAATGAEPQPAEPVGYAGATQP